MTPPPLSNVSHGLMLAHWGFRLIACGVVGAAGNVVMASVMGLSHREVER